MRKIQLLIIFISLSFFSCEEVINVDLQNVTPRLVIEAIVTDQPGPYTVNLSKSGNFFDSNVFPQVSGAIVIISDVNGNSDTLKENQPGIYQTNTLKGTIGYDYTLKVLSEGKEYISKTTMQVPIQIDSVTYDSRQKNHGKDSNLVRYDVHCFFRDRPGIKDYVLLKVFINNVVQKDNFLYDGKYTDGDTIDFSRFRHIYELQDSVRIEMYTLNYEVFNYFSTLNSILGSEKIKGIKGIREIVSTGTPDNPNSNISNGALGYFAVYSVQSKSIVIK